ncbi:MAG: carbohydrate ABC transporter permease [Dolichospermum sp. DET50]|nr:carbohydrate ABC transporter permease [Dolichospermum sp. DET66]MBS3035274.1 carbohydrate ABC transporter permease [Dolichospermum sp. DET67]MBS3040474.1 carbohydrate ABC transporter permease [Dolichospermum sp. DET50]QSX67614.1 MAG: carbohydrate ABC transporter permease [Dolichospermum sp. DET69]
MSISQSQVQKIIGKVVIYLILTLLAFLFVAPILFMIVGSLKPDDLVLIESGSIKAFIPDQISFQNYQNVFERVNFTRFFFNSLFITSMIVLVGLLVNSMAAYAFARMQWQGRDILFAVVLALMIIPFEAIAVPLFFQITLVGLRNTYIAQIVPFIANSLAIYLFYTFFIGLPKELEEAAKVDGASTFQTFFAIIVPVSKPVFATVAILTFLTQWGSFLWPVMVTVGENVRPLPVAIAEFQTLPPLQWGDIMAFGVMMVAPVLIIFLIFQKWFVKGVASSGVKG